ncbi:MAG: SDR family NAD(P)-dependent oxidoreductase [Gemmatimonadota bacterium]
MSRIEGQRVLITGASAGIGEACASRFAEDDANLVLWARRIDRLEDLATRLRDAHGVSVEVAGVDVRDRDAVSAAAADLTERGGLPDILVNNAGLASGLDPVQTGSLDDWDRMIDTNVKGLLFVTRAFLPGMIARETGHVINIGSIAGRQIYPRGAVYTATKFAVRALTEGTSIDLLGTMIRVSSVSPGLVETDFSRVRFHGDEERAAAVYADTTPLTAGDVAECVSFVANAPPHVNVADVLVLATDQRSAHHLHRNS